MDIEGHYSSEFKVEKQQAVSDLNDRVRYSSTLST